MLARRTVVLAAVAALMLALLPRASGASPIELDPICNQTLSDSGKYVLTGDMTSCPGDVMPVLTISAPKVTLDLNGFTISGDGINDGTTDIGILLTGPANDTTVTNGLLEAHGAAAFFAPNNPQTSVSDLVVRDIEGEGIVIVGEKSSADNVTVINTARGISISGDGSKVSNSQVSDTTLLGIELYGVKVVVDNNVADDTDGIFVNGDKAKVSNNTSLRSDISGFALSGNNLNVSGNRAARNLLQGFSMSGTSWKVSDNRAHDNDASGFDASDADDVVGKSNKAYGNDLGGCTPSDICNTPATKPPVIAPSCGQTITTSGRLEANVGPCPLHGITIGTDNVTLDLNGFGILGNSDNDDTFTDEKGITVPAGTDNVKIQNGIVSGFEYGVIASDADGFTITDVLARDNQSIVVDANDSNGARFQGVYVTETQFGFGIAGVGDGVKVSDSVVVGAFNSGFLVVGKGVKVADNVAVSSGLSGFDIHGEKPKVTGNTAIANTRDGIRVRGGTGTLSGNNAHASPGDGFWFDNTGLDVDGKWKVTGNDAHDNGDHGFQVVDFTTIVAKNNLAFGNGTACTPPEICS